MKNILFSIDLENDYLRKIDSVKYITELHGRNLMLGIIWHRQVIIHLEFLKCKEKLNAHLYIYQMQRGHRCLIEDHPDFVNSKNISHDKARTHTARITQEKKKEFGWFVLTHPLYSLPHRPSMDNLFRAVGVIIHDSSQGWLLY